MTSSQIKSNLLPSHTSLAAKILRSVLAVIGCSGIAELILQQIGQTCFVTCVVSMAIALASQLAAFGERPKDDAPVQARTLVQATALLGRVNARSGEPIAGAIVSLTNFATHRQASTVSATGGSFQFAGVAPGEYRLEVSAPGYKTFVVTQIPLVAGDVANANAVLDPGLPFTVLNANDVSNTNPGASAADRPNQVSSANLSHSTVGQYFNVDAFAAQAPGTLGNERSNQLYGPPTRHLDASLFKNLGLGGERTVQFRTEVFNVTNTANFASPAAILGGSNFGRLTQLTAGYTPREIQFAMRLQF